MNALALLRQRIIPLLQIVTLAAALFFVSTVLVAVLARLIEGPTVQVPRLDSVAVLFGVPTVCGIMLLLLAEHIEHRLYARAIRVPVYPRR